jgi:hypothetical protein
VGNRILVALAVTFALYACGDGGTGPDDGTLTVTAQSNETQFGARGTILVEPLQAIVVDPVTKVPQANVTVSWRVVTGTATLTSPVSTTDGNGVASAFVRVANDLATSTIEASVSKLSGSPARFTVRAVDAPVMNTLAPGSARAGDTITITGTNFSPVAADNAVLFSGFRGNIVSASATQMRVVVPLCVPARTLDVQVLLGAVAGNALPLAVTSSTTTALELARGDTRTFADPAELACFRLPAVANFSVLLMPQNASEVIGSFTVFELAGLTGATPVGSVVEKPSLHVTPEDSWEMSIRRKERELLQGPVAASRPQYSASSAANCPKPAQIGDRCDFQVINKDDDFERVTAEVKAITTHAIVYQDIRTPAESGLTTDDFNRLGAVFDDPIYSTDVALFGQPSDYDSNGKIFILLTPVVNALTPSSSTTSFIAGFFYGCDLLARGSCSGSNEAEIFYALTTDPNMQFSARRTRTDVMNSLPAVLAHEFQHMINFAQRNKTQDVLWLAEGLAHHAEDAVADVYEARGDGVSAAQFRAQNTTRANRYLRATSSVSLLASDDASSLELRGAAWLFVKYLTEQHGNQILAKLTSSTQTSVSNVTTQTGKTWSTLMADWGIALWADDAPELAGVTLRRELTYPSVNLRQRLKNFDASYPLKPTVYGFIDFIERETIPASSQAYVIVKAGATTPPQLNLTLGGQRGGAFPASAVPQLTVLRIN